MANQKHLLLEQRITIQEMLSKRCSFTEIGRTLDKDPSTISKEIRNHLVFLRSGYRHIKFNACRHRLSCNKVHVCFSCNPDRHYKKCRNCPACNRNCPDFTEEICSRLLKPPYVCNSCPSRNESCTLEKRFYYADQAQAKYKELLSESRSGISYSEEEIRFLDNFISPLIKKSQSPHHICVTNSDTLMVSESTIYRLIDSGLIAARNIDLPRKVRFRHRIKKVSFKVDRTCRIGRSYEDFRCFLKEHPDIPITQLDSVEGRKGGKVLLTIHFVKAELMLAFLRNHNDSASVTRIFNDLYRILGHGLFSCIFRLCLPDNGSEFSNPKAIEFNNAGIRRTRIFYCDPSAPYQKGSAERNHEFIRMFIPKGTDLEPYTQEDINLMMDHINSYRRESIGNRAPYEMFSFLYGQKALDLLGCHLLPPQEVTLNRSIFDKEASK
ncbi:MAG: IS30 family transposase [Lachnospiraceae bacterium]|nr:IS30 family transposase [Lachnospiraceae bacterium]